MTNLKLSFFFLRLPVAISVLGHGLVRLPKLQVFSNWMMTTMEKSAIPSLFIKSFSYMLPFLEVIIGLALLAGFKIKYAIYAALLVMSVLILGSCSIENWGAIEAQLIHAGYLAFLLWYYEKNLAAIVK